MTQEELIEHLSKRLARCEKALGIKTIEQVEMEARNQLRRETWLAKRKHQAEVIAGGEPAQVKLLLSARDADMLRQALALIAFQARGEWMQTRALRAALDCRSDAAWARVAGVLGSDPAVVYHHGKGWCRNV
jgi:hypothetical protein